LVNVPKTTMHRRDGPHGRDGGIGPELDDRARAPERLAALTGVSITCSGSQSGDCHALWRADR